MQSRLLLYSAGAIAAAGLFFLGTNDGHARGVHEVHFWEPERFADAVAAHPSEPSGIRGGLVPHHLLASPLIAEVFAHAGSVRRVVLIGPNHHELGEAAFITSLYDWKGPNGSVRADIQAIEKLIENGASADEEAIAAEHSIGGIVPYIRHYAPGARIVPLIVSMKASLSDLERMAGQIEMISGPDTLVVASVDFSHYLQADEAKRRNAETLVIIGRRDFEALIGLSSDHVDSPRSLILLFTVMDQLGAVFQPLADTTSGEFGANPLGESTSYISGIFR